MRRKHGNLIGYARCNPLENDIKSQVQDLLRAGCTKVFEEPPSTARSRVTLASALQHAREGDTIVVLKLECVGRSLRHLLQLINELHHRNIGFRSLHENVDTTASNGAVVTSLFGTLAKFDRGLQLAKRRPRRKGSGKNAGKSKGRPLSLTPSQFAKAKAMYEAGTVPIPSICEKYGITRATLYNYLSKYTDASPVRAKRMASEDSSQDGQCSAPPLP